MDLDTALAELRVLAAVSEARRELLLETRRNMNNENRTHRLSLHVGGARRYKCFQDKTVPLISIRKAFPNLCQPSRSASFSRNRHLFMPYEQPRPSMAHPHRVTALCVQSPNIGTLQLPQLPQNKSNPPSPVKNNPHAFGVNGGPLVRSKSLDNIALCPLDEIRTVDKIVDSVSSKISNLQLTAN
ncbi:uncharacterized protein LOC100902569 [Galendromus occidentalis]|uniref:Uncharacterized protein LOC100902569 n=1 Tax=Galendromus occidentalis TaxID=34638 RepID=A0AAJ6QZ22_9ACAR|nr:uncharacterized protein LOC100902569 [Galendromus occidentalis]